MHGLRQMRLARKLSLRDTAAQTGVSTETISRLERGVSMPDIEQVQKLANFFGCSYEKMASFFPMVREQMRRGRPTMRETWTPSVPVEPGSLGVSAKVSMSDIEKAQITAYTSGLRDARRATSTVLVPILGTTAAGFERPAAPENRGEYIAMLKDSIRGNPDEYFALGVHGDSMYPSIQDGDTAIFHEQPTLENGEIGLILYGDVSAPDGLYGTLKKFHRNSDNSIELVALNPDVENIVLRDSQLEQLQIQGKLAYIVRGY